MIRIKPNIAGALANQRLQRNLKFTLANSLHSRQAAVSEVANWEELRDHARTVKMRTLARLHDHLLELERNVIAHGGQVHWADDADAALALVGEIVRRRQVRSVVKSKTMLGEEIRVNEALASAGVEVVETDLGEYIVQLAGEPPSHIVTPAFHKSKEEVSDLFAEKLGAEPTSDVTEMTLTARRVLRQKFLQADMGISGANFGIAETGTIVVIENEGNARLSTSVPKTHVVLMGIEKVIPRTRDLPVFLKLLTRSATGQRISSYVNLISGPRREGEIDGPDEFHLILVDNGRSRILADSFLRQTLSCIRCGACLNVCPVFQTIGGHAYDSVYQGPIGAILTPQLLSRAEEAPDHPFASSLCCACRDACPVKIDIPHILLKLREKVQRNGAGFLERLGFTVWAWVSRSPFRFAVAGRAMRFGAGLMVRNGRLRFRVPPVKHWDANRDLPCLPEKSFREIMSKERNR